MSTVKQIREKPDLSIVEQQPRVLVSWFEEEILNEKGETTRCILIIGVIGFLIGNTYNVGVLGAREAAVDRNQRESTPSSKDRRPAALNRQSIGGEPKGSSLKWEKESSSGSSKVKSEFLEQGRRRLMGIGVTRRPAATIDDRRR
ncbi:hypothetical protein L1887_18900 [Cichorium endivia]|nr:hypothetical protein L1887_18900 [Cichorium endivia]